MREAQRLQRAIFSILIIALFMGQWIFPAQIAHAQNLVGVPTVPADTAANVATAGAQKATLVENVLQTAKSFAEHFKEFIGDSLANMVAKTVLRTITQSTVNWINSGFKGSPAFVTNPEGFLADVTDQVVGQTIEELVPFVCSPFQLDIRIALGLNFSFNTQREIHCRLSDVIANVNGAYNAFVGGDFGAGGWSSWIAITGSPQNNPYGAYLSTVSAINARMVNAAGQEVKLLDWGKGFMSWRECEVPGDPYSVPNAQNNGPKLDSNNQPIIRYGPCKKKGPIKTPGSVIESNLATALGADLNALGVGDEINEVFAALVNQLIKQVFTSTGLAGASDRSINPYAYSGTVDTGQITESYVQGTATDLNTVRNSEGSIQLQAESDAQGRATTISGAVQSAINAGVGNYDFSSGSFAPAPRTGNVALYKYAEQSSRYLGKYPPSRAVDGNEDSDYSSSHTAGDINAWWQVDLSRSSDRSNRYTIEEITEIQIIPRNDCFTNASVYISENKFGANDNTNGLPDAASLVAGPFSYPRNGIITIKKEDLPPDTKGPYLRIQQNASGLCLGLSEVRVYGTETIVAPERAAGVSGVTSGAGSDSLALNKKTSQSSTATGKDSALAVDGTVNSLAATESEQNPWWQVDLSETQAQGNARYQVGQITRVDVYPKFSPGVRDFAVFADPRPAGVSDSTFSLIQNLARDVCNQTPVPKVRIYPIIYSDTGDIGTVIPGGAEKTWNLRIQRCNPSGSAAPLELYEVTVSGTEIVLASGRVPAPPVPLISIKSGSDDVTDGEIVLNNPNELENGKIFNLTANETKTGVRIGVKLQTAIGGTAVFTNELWSNIFQGFSVSSQVKKNNSGWIAQPTVDFVTSLPGACSALTPRCINVLLTNKNTPNRSNPDHPIIFLSGLALNKGDQASVTLTGELPPNLANGSYKIILQVFQGDGVIPISSATVRFTKK